MSQEGRGQSRLSQGALLPRGPRGWGKESAGMEDPTGLPASQEVPLAGGGEGEEGSVQAAGGGDDRDHA